MNEMELMKILNEKEQKYYNRAVSCREEGKDDAAERFMSLYFGVAYLKLRFHTKFKNVKEISAEELLKLIKNMTDEYDLKADNAWAKGNREKEAKWLGVMLAADFVRDKIYFAYRRKLEEPA